MSIDVCFPDEVRWNKISLRMAEEEVEKEKARETAIVRKRLDSLSDVADWDGGGTQDPHAIAAVPPGPRPRPRPPSPVPGPSNGSGLPPSTTLQRFANGNPPRRWGATS